MGGGAMNADELISIHAPRMGSDAGFNATGESDMKFQSTLPAWGATS